MSNRPELLTGVISRRDLLMLMRCVGATAALSLVMPLTLGALYILAEYDMRGSSIAPLAFLGVVEAATVLLTAMTLRIVYRTGADLDHADLYGTLTILGKLVSAPAIALPLATTSSRNGEILGGELLVLFGGTAAALGTLAVHSVFLRNLVRGVVPLRTRRAAEELGTLNVVVLLLAAASMFCTIGLAIAPAVLALGACVNAVIAAIFWRGARRHAFSRG